MNKVLALDGVDPAGINILNRHFDVDVRNKIDADELLNIIGNYDALMVRSQTKVTGKVIEAGKNLKVIGRAGVGVDNIDVPAATRKGIIVVNSPEGNTIAAAEHTIALLLSLARHIPFAHQSLKNGEWKRKDFTGIELYKKVLGIIGVGKIGGHVAKVCKSMGMTILGYDPYINKKKAEELNIEIVDLERIFADSDFITVHVPLSAETRNMINLDSMKKMKKTVKIVNCARGGIVNENDVIYALENGIIGGAALDVFEQEPLVESPLQKVPGKLIITPHLGASTEEAQINVSIDVSEQITSVLLGESVKNAVNLPGMDISKELKPYLGIAVKIGLLTGQLVNKDIKNIEIKYHGKLAGEKSTMPLAVAVIKGILSPALQETINYVNAMTVAHDRGINIQESYCSEETNYKSMITVKATSEKGSCTVSGIIVKDQGERIVQIDNYDIDFLPEGKLIVTRNIDKPGMVGKIGNILGNNNINIARMDLGRVLDDKTAMMIISVDENVSEKVLEQLRGIDGIISTSIVSL